MIKSSFELEKKLQSQGYDFVIGVDEAGRGPLAGPVVACAAYRNCQFAMLISRGQVGQNPLLSRRRDIGPSPKRERRKMRILILI